MNRGIAESPLSDAELTRAAQAGDAGSLGVLLARHEAAMRAVALGMIGYGPDNDDVVQDAALVAAWRAQADAIRARYGTVVSEPVPQRFDVAVLARGSRKWSRLAAAAVLLFA